MKKHLLLPLLFLMSGCSHFSINATNCDDIMRNDPTMQNVPAECRNYKEEDEQKATYPPGERPVGGGKDFKIGK